MKTEFRIWNEHRLPQWQQMTVVLQTSVVDEAVCNALAHILAEYFSAEVRWVYDNGTAHYTLPSSQK